MNCNIAESIQYGQAGTCEECNQPTGLYKNIKEGKSCMIVTDDNIGYGHCDGKGNCIQN
jgi:hypothetical protein